MNKKLAELGTELAIKSEGKFRNLAESLSELVYRANSDTFAIKYVNKSIEEIYGYTLEEWLNKPELWEKAINPDDKERVFAKIKEAQNKYEPFTIQYKIIRKDASIKGWVAFNIKKTFLDHTETSGFSRMIRELIFSKYLEIYHLERYRHRMSMDGKPLYYFGLAGRKQADIPDGFLEKYNLSS